MGFVVINYNVTSGFSLYKCYLTTNEIGAGNVSICYFKSNFFVLTADSSYNSLLYKSSNGENF